MKSKYLKTSIAKRMAVGYMTLIAIIVIIAGIGWNSINISISQARQMTSIDLPLERLADEWLTGIKVNSVRTLAVARSSDENTRQFFGEQIKMQTARVNEIQTQLEKALVSDEERSQLTEVARVRKIYQGIRAEIFKAQAAGNMKLVIQMTESNFLPALDVYMNAAAKLKNIEIAKVDKITENLNKDLDTGRNLLLFFTIIALCFGIMVCIYSTRKITIPLKHAVDVAVAIAAGRLDTKIESTSNDETGRLLNELRIMQNNLAHIVSETQEAANTISVAAERVLSGNTDLSARTESQASALEETVSSLEQLTATVQQNAANAQQVSQMSKDATDLALNGGDMVTRMVGMIGEINDSSKRVAEIIGLIDTIAFQTNILALNAAVEAARAGEQGRGFAVVAGEVRNLALQSTTASKEIKTLILASGEKVEAGYSLAGQAGTTMTEIVDNIKNVTELINEIAVASQQQSSGIEQINQAIVQMNETTQQNSALVEEAAASADSMTSQSKKLIETVSAFKS